MQQTLTKKEWGNSVWTFFHLIANRIDENKFNIIKSDIINVTKLICSNLPCPECSEDSNKILKNINLEKVINNKNDLKNGFIKILIHGFLHLLNYDHKLNKDYENSWSMNVCY